MSTTRRSMLAAIGLSLPLVVPSRLWASGGKPILTYLAFEDAVRLAFAGVTLDSKPLWRRVEIGHIEQGLSGLPGCYNDGPFAGYPDGHLRITRAGTSPGPLLHGVRLYIATLDIELSTSIIGTPLDFRDIPPAPILSF